MYIHRSYFFGLYYYSIFILCNKIIFIIFENPEVNPLALYFLDIKIYKLDDIKHKLLRNIGRKFGVKILKNQKVNAYF